MPITEPLALWRERQISRRARAAANVGHTGTVEGIDTRDEPDLAWMMHLNGRQALVLSVYNDDGYRIKMLDCGRICTIRADLIHFTD